MLAPQTKRPLIRLAVMAAAAFMTAGCADEAILGWLASGYESSTFDVQSTDMGPAIMSLYSTFFWLALIVFLAVEGLLIYAAVRFRRKKTDTERPEQVHGNTRVELAWTIAPAIIILLITIPTVQTIFELASPPDSEDQVQVRVVGKQWWWIFEYPELGIVTANELHLPAGRTAVFNIESDDVIHSFWFPQMGGKRDATPGHTNFMYFTPKQSGRFWGACTEFCGTQHANMRKELVVHSNDDFEAWVEQQRTIPEAATAEEFGEARDAFMMNCAACHRVAGVAEFGRLGPDLTHFASRRMFASGMFERTDELLADWLRDPQAMKEGNLMEMPMELDEETIQQLVAFLQNLK